MWKVKTHGCGNTAPATQHGARKLSGTERTLEQNRAAAAQKFDYKGAALSPQEKSLLWPASLHSSAFSTRMNCAAHQLRLGLGQDTQNSSITTPVFHSITLFWIVWWPSHSWSGHCPRAGPCLLKVGRGGRVSSCQVSL